MNIVLINHYAGSPEYGMEYRPYYLAKELIKLGCNVTIIAASFSHLRQQVPLVQGNFFEEEIDGIKYIWLRTPEYHGNGLKRALNMLIFAWRLLVYHKSLACRLQPDVVLASSPHPFIIVGAERMRRVCRAKLVFEVRDLWPLTIVELGGVSPKNPFILLMQKAENFAYRKADLVVSLLPKAKSYMIEHGMKPNRFLYLPNGIPLGEWQDVSQQLPNECEMLIAGLKEKKYYLVGYTGTHGVANALEYLIEAASLLQQLPVAIISVGEGTEKKWLQKKCREMQLDNIFFQPAISKNMIPSFLDKMDLLFIGWKKSSLYRFGISPNKLMDYMFSGKPVIHAVEAGNDMVHESGCGLSIPPEDPIAIARAIEELINLSTEDRQKIGLNGRRFVLANLSYQVLAEKLLRELSA